MSKSNIHTIALLGFNADEREIIKKIFDLLHNSNRAFYYSLAPDRLTKMPDGFLVDTENTAAVSYWQRLMDHQATPTVSIGQVPLDPTVAHATRPISFRAIKLLDRAMGADAANDQEVAVEQQAAASIAGAKERRRIASDASDALPERREAPERRKAPRASTKERRKGDRRNLEDTETTNVVPLHAGKPAMPTINEGTSTILQVLIVDDSVVVRNFLRTRIASPRIAIDFAENGEQALEIVKKKRYGLIFLDVVMPGIDGYDTCKRIRKMAGYGAAKVVMITGRDGTFDKIKGTMAGCDAYLTKPVDQEKLKSLVEESVAAALKAAK